MVVTLRLPVFLVAWCLLGWAEQPEAILQRAVQAHQAGDMPAAIQGYREFLKIEPGNVLALSNLGAALARQGEYDDAVREYKEALSLVPDNPAISLNLALAYYKLGEIAKASAELIALRARQPENQQATLLLADCWLRLGENQKVITMLDPLYAAHRDDGGLAYLLGTALVRDGQTNRGQLVIDKILHNGDSAEARLLMGTTKFSVHDFAGAVKDLARAVELNTSLPSVHSYYGQALLATGDAAGAMRQFRLELQQDPNDFNSNLDLGALLRQDQELDEAAHYIERAMRVRPGDPGAGFQMASIKLAQGKLEEARERLEHTIQESPTFVEAHVTLATVYYRLKRKADGDRERAVVQKLNAEIQARQPAAQAGAPGPAEKAQ